MLPQLQARLRFDDPLVHSQPFLLIQPKTGPLRGNPAAGLGEVQVLRFTYRAAAKDLVLVDQRRLLAEKCFGWAPCPPARA